MAFSTHSGSVGSTYDKSTCACSNALFEVKYYVKIEAKDTPKGLQMGKKYYAIDNIKAQILLYKDPIVDGNCNTPQKSKVGVNQKFTIEFYSSKDIGSSQKSSGSPGYLNSYPVKLGWMEKG